MASITNDLGILVDDMFVLLLNDDPIVPEARDIVDMLDSDRIDIRTG